MSNEHASTKYRQPAQQGGSPRETEGRALMEAARRLAIAKDNPDDGATLADTVRLNWRLWTIFQSELTERDIDLPEELRNNMLTLCNYVDKRTVEILSDPKPDMLDVLININRNIAAGLLAKSDAATAPDEDKVGELLQTSVDGLTA
jgi:flagellar protein FlaF